MDVKTITKTLCSKIGVSGLENEAAKAGADILSELGEIQISPLGSVICTVKKPTEGMPHILLDAHIDEIGLIVSYIDEDGFIKAGACGGIDRRLLLASQVTIHCESGDIKGIICSIPPHLQPEGEKKNPKLQDIFIDVGMNMEKAKQVISLGDRITLDDTPKDMLNGYISSKSLDDRAGCATIIKAAQLLKNEKYNCGLTVVLSTMEEVGGQGSDTATYMVNPTHAIAVDVSFAHTPDAPKNQCGTMKQGPMIGFAPVLNKETSETLVKVAKKNNIPFQYEAMGGKTGTNADDIAITRGGICTGLISIPQKYMHTPIEVVAVEDMENTAKLIAEYIKEAF